MKIRFVKSEKNELHVVLSKNQLDREVEDIMNLVQQADYKITGTSEGVKYQISTKDVVYIESYERKLYIYTAEDIYTSNKRLNQYIDELRDMGLIQINKSTLMNTDKIHFMRMLPNSKIEVVLTTGDKLNVSRTYIYQIKSYLQGELI